MSKKKVIITPPPVLPCTGVESHAHLDSKQYVDDLEDVLARAKQAGVERIGQIFLSPTAYANNVARFDAHPEVFFLLGVHPTEAFLYSPETAKAMVEIIQADPRVRAIGEIGLDYYWKEVLPSDQKDIFVAQLALAKACDLPVVIHSRDAAEDTFAILDAEGFVGRPLLWHCFGGDTAMARKIVDAGWHLSIPGIVTYPANTALRAAVAAIPLERLLIETDCPYLTPMPLRGKRNEPAYLPYTIEAMAAARQMPIEELWTICGDNAKRFFGLQPL